MKTTKKYPRAPPRKNLWKSARLEQGTTIRKGIVLKCTANEQQIGRKFREKGEKKRREVGTRVSKILTLSKFIQTKQTKDQAHTRQTKRKRTLSI